MKFHFVLHLGEFGWTALFQLVFQVTFGASYDGVFMPSQDLVISSSRPNVSVWSCFPLLLKFKKYFDWTVISDTCYKMV